MTRSASGVWIRMDDLVYKIPSLTKVGDRLVSYAKSDKIIRLFTEFKHNNRHIVEPLHPVQNLHNFYVKYFMT